MKRIINIETGEVIERELNADELAQQAADEAAAQVIQAAEQAEAEAKAQAKAELLQRLGITAEEAQLLLS